MFRKKLLPVLLSSLWISLSEFVRNEFLLKNLWVSHYENLGLTFPSAPVNGALWGIWSLLFALAIFFLSRRFLLMQTALLSWLAGFVLMWVVIFNLGVLPLESLLWAIPLSLLESFVATWIIVKVGGKG